MFFFVGFWGHTLLALTFGAWLGDRVGRILRKTLSFSFSCFEGEVNVDAEGFSFFGVSADKTSSWGNGGISHRLKLCGVVLGVARAFRWGFRRMVTVLGQGGGLFRSIADDSLLSLRWKWIFGGKRQVLCLNWNPECRKAGKKFGRKKKDSLMGFTPWALDTYEISAPHWEIAAAFYTTIFFHPPHIF